MHRPHLRVSGFLLCLAMAACGSETPVVGPSLADAAGSADQSAGDLAAGSDADVSPSADATDADAVGNPDVAVDPDAAGDADTIPPPDASEVADDAVAGSDSVTDEGIAPDAPDTDKDAPATPDTQDADSADPDVGQPDVTPVDVVPSDTAPVGCTSDAQCVGKATVAACQAAVCGADGLCATKATGDGTVCDDGNACTSDACDPKSGLCVFAAGAGALCDDGNNCTTTDTCAQGKCTGKAVACDDANPCTADSCEAKVGCVFAPNTATCDDGNACTETDGCAAGKCGGKAKVCNDGSPCTDDACDPKTGCTKTNNKATCALGSACETGQCTDGQCKTVGKTGCDDNNACTVDTCDATKGCQFKPVADGNKCGTANACVAQSTCQAGVCAAGTKTDCSDGNACTTDFCDAAAGCSWTPNTAPCDDGNACTKGEVCGVIPGQGPTCKPGTAVDVATACNDQNVCTQDSCDPKAGCVYAPIAGACNDGNVCTSGEACTAGKCAGGSNTSCDDGKPCTTDNCDPKSGACSWTGKTGTCDDNNQCTEQDVCSNGKCAGGAVLCDDKNPCTKDACDPAKGCVFTAADGPCNDGDGCTAGDACAGGKCAGKPAAVTCNDGNTCTTDSCDPKTGTCTFVAAPGPCDGGDKCTSGDTCTAGKCVTGKVAACDDGSACTSDSCDPATGKCSFTAAADGLVCDDGIACTSESACKGGACVPKTTSCAVFTDTFNCATPGAGWTLDAPPGKQVRWKVDQLPLVPDQAKYACTLNFNDDKDYCDPVQGPGGATNYCQLPTGVATSPAVDVSKVVGTPALSFDTYMDLDTINANNDRPRVTIRDADTKVVLEVHLLPNTAGDMKKWKLVSLPLVKAVGKKITVGFDLAQGDNLSTNNTGAGWFIDNFKVDAQLGAEACGDGIDNDGNGKVDCADFACKGNALCAEVCDDGKDNDFDDAIDCADADCTTKIQCGIKLVNADLNCGEGGWTFANSSPSVIWAIDGSPAAPVGPTPVSGQCTLNYNNGTNYMSTNQFNQGTPNAGLATYGATIDGTGTKQLAAQFFAWVDVEPLTAQSENFDRTWLQVSTDDFAGCCGATANCGDLSNTCNTANTKTFLLPRIKAWTKHIIDLKDFLGKKFKVRFRFNSGDGQLNNFAGPFVDDFRLFSIK